MNKEKRYGPYIPKDHPLYDHVIGQFRPVPENWYVGEGYVPCRKNNGIIVIIDDELIYCAGTHSGINDAISNWRLPKTYKIPIEGSEIDSILEYLQNGNRSSL